MRCEAGRDRRRWAGCVAFLAILLGLGCGSGNETDRTGEPAAKPGVRARPVTPPPAHERAPEAPPPPAPEPDPEPPEPRARRPEPFTPPPDESPIGELPEDVPVPQGAHALHPPLRSEEGLTHASYEFEGPVASARSFYASRLLAEGWVVEPAYGTGAETLMTARKGERQLSVTMAELEGRTHIVILETDRAAR